MAAATALIVGATAIGVGGSLYSASAQAKAMKRQSAYESTIYEQNAQMLELKADYALEQGESDAAFVKEKGRAIRGTQRSGYAGQGVDVNSGTAVDIVDETYTRAETDAVTVKNNAYREAWGFKTQASQQRYSARFGELAAKSGAKQTLLTGGLQATNQILQGYQLYKK